MKLGKASTRTRIDICGMSNDKMKEKRIQPEAGNACITLVGNNKRKKLIRGLHADIYRILARLGTQLSPV